MKKIILTAAAVFAFSFANAQDLKSSKGENYLPEAGDWSISFNADNLFDYAGNAFSNAGNNTIGQVQNSNASGSFTGKKFVTATQADRYTAGFVLGNSSVTAANGTETVSTSIKVAAGIGKEWRKGKTRLQGFYGYDLLANMTLVDNTKTTSAGGTVDAKGGFVFGVGANGFLGAEYFLFPKIAIGAQYTYGVNLNIGAAGTTTTTPVGGTATETKGAKSTSFGVGNVGVASMSLSLYF
jgi:hypothetical protein